MDYILKLNINTDSHQNNTHNFLYNIVYLPVFLPDEPEDNLNYDYRDNYYKSRYIWVQKKLGSFEGHYHNEAFL